MTDRQIIEREFSWRGNSCRVIDGGRNPSKLSKLSLSLGITHTPTCQTALKELIVSLVLDVGRERRLSLWLAALVNSLAQATVNPDE
jgi:hypothetical protein